jgi:hypothetical protein
MVVINKCQDLSEFGTAPFLDPNGILIGILVIGFIRAVPRCRDGIDNTKEPYPVSIIIGGMFFADF